MVPRHRGSCIHVGGVGVNRFLNYLFVFGSAVMLLLAVAATAYHFGYRSGIETKVTIVGEKYKVTLKEGK